MSLRCAETTRASVQLSRRLLRPAATSRSWREVPCWLETVPRDISARSIHLHPSPSLSFPHRLASSCCASSLAFCQKRLPLLLLLGSQIKGTSRGFPHASSLVFCSGPWRTASAALSIIQGPSLLPPQSARTGASEIRYLNYFCELIRTPRTVRSFVKRIWKYWSCPTGMWIMDVA